MDPVKVAAEATVDTAHQAVTSSAVNNGRNEPIRRSPDEEPISHGRNHASASRW